MVLRKVNEEQGIVDYKNNQRNICQYDLLRSYDNVLIASLWQDQNNDWYLTERLYDCPKTVKYLGAYHCEFKDIARAFINAVIKWLSDDITYLCNICNDLEENYVMIEE